MAGLVAGLLLVLAGVVLGFVLAANQVDPAGQSRQQLEEEVAGLRASTRLLMEAWETKQGLHHAAEDGQRAEAACSTGSWEA